MFAERLSLHLDRSCDEVVFLGNSPNDAQIFAQFPLGIGVAYVCDFADRLPHEPAFVTQACSAVGFCELADRILAARA